MQHSARMHRLECPGDGNRCPKRRARLHARSHTTPQIASLEILHHQPRVLVADTEIVELDDARVTDTLDNCVFLQKTAERVVEVVLILVSVPDHLQCNQRSCRFTLRKIQVRYGACGNSPDTSIPANEGAAESLRVTSNRAGAPFRPRARLHPLGIVENLKELLAVDLVTPDYSVRTDLEGLGRVHVVGSHGDEDDWCETGPGSQVSELVETAAMAKQNCIESLCKKFRRKRALQIGAADHNLRIRLTRRQTMLDDFALSRVVFDQQQTHCSITARAYRTRHGLPLRSAPQRPTA